MGFDRRKYEEEQTWRAAEFVIAYTNWGDRGRMRGSSASAPGTLHRSTCRFLAVDTRVHVNSPAHVYAHSVDDYVANVAKAGGYTEYKVCQVCCADVDAPVSVKDDRGRVQRYQSTRAYKAQVALAELNVAEKAQRDAQKALDQANANVDELRRQVRHVAGPGFVLRVGPNYGYILEAKVEEAVS